MGKPYPKPQLVTPVTTILERTTYNNGVKATTEAETKERKKKFLDILDKATDKFLQNLQDDKVDLTSTLDLERIVKMVLVISGEADSITGQTGSATASAATEAKLSMSKIEEILNLDDPNVQAMFQQIYTGYNELNDAVCAEKEK